MANIGNNPIHFKQGEDLIKKIRATDSSHIDTQNGIIYFDSANRQIILGQDNTAIDGSGTKYKIYSDLYQTLFYATGQWDSVHERWKIIISVAEETNSFLANNMTSLRINFLNAKTDNSNTTTQFYLITEYDEENDEDNDKGEVIDNSTDKLFWEANSVLDFIYTVEDGLNSQFIPISNANTDNKVTQSADTTSKWRKILLHYNEDDNYNSAVTTSTAPVYASQQIAIQPSTGNLQTAGSITIRPTASGVTMEYDENVGALNFIFS